MKPRNTTIIILVLATFLAGIALYALWEAINKHLNLPNWIFFLVYSITIPTVGFYRVLYWGYWLSKTERKES